MIYFLTGRPGGGKSLTMAEKIYKALKSGKNVIANFEINEDYFKKYRHPEKLGKFLYVPNEWWLNNGFTNIDPRLNRYSYIDGLYGFAKNFHKTNEKGQIKEGQTLLVLDECQELFNSRSWNRKDRLIWCQFFRIHRHYGYTCYLISQDDKNIDKQIRGILQKEIECRSVSNMKLFGKILSILCGGSLFVRIYRDYTLGKKKDAKEGSQFYLGRRYYNFYDSYKTFD